MIYAPTDDNLRFRLMVPIVQWSDGSGLRIRITYWWYAQGNMAWRDILRWCTIYACPPM